MDFTIVDGVELVQGLIFIFVVSGVLVRLLHLGDSFGFPHFAAFLEGVVDEVNKQEAETDTEEEFTQSD